MSRLNLLEEASVYCRIFELYKNGHVCKGCVWHIDEVYSFPIKSPYEDLKEIIKEVSHKLEGLQLCHV